MSLSRHYRKNKKNGSSEFQFLLNDLKSLDELWQGKGNEPLHPINHGWKNMYVDPTNPLMMKDPKVEDFCRVRVYFWWPELFFHNYLSKMPCPNPDCETPDVNLNGWNKDGPRLVSGLQRSFWILCKSYHCKNCDRKFQGYNEASLSKMPVEVRHEFPAMVNQKSAMDLGSVSIIQRQICNGQSFQDVRKLAREMNYLEYWRRHCQYLHLSVSRRIKKGHFITDRIQPFPEFQFRKGASVSYPGVVPPSSHIKKVLTTKLETEKDLKVAKMMTLKGRILKGDHTFKIAKIPFQLMEKVFEASYSVMNEFGQIIGYWMTVSRSLNELREELGLVAKRYPIGDGPELYYIDNCCSERSTLQDIFPSLKKGTATEVLSFPGTPIVVKSDQEIQLACERLSECDVLGFDLEWNVSFEKGVSPSMTSTIQLAASDSLCYIFQVARFHELRSLPQPLKNILESSCIKKVGVNIIGDAKKLKKDFGVRVKGTVELEEKFEGASKSLAGLVLYVLGKVLDKPLHVIFSDWEAEKLKKDQRLYASTDAYAGLLLYQAFKNGVRKAENLTMDETFHRILLDAFHFMDRYFLI
jgi:hypothetical protein